MDLVKVKYSLCLHIQKQTIIDDITKKIKEIPNLELLKNDPELVRYILELLVNSVSKKQFENTEFKQITYDIMVKVFPSLTQEEKNGFSTFEPTKTKFLFSLSVLTLVFCTVEPWQS